MSAVVEVRELSRWYGLVMGLNNVSFDIEPGLTGLVGPNGAGKSTLIQVITGQLQPSSGSISVLGETPWNNPNLLKRIGYCPERESLPTELQPRDWLRSLALISGVSTRSAGALSEALLHRVKLDPAHWGKRMGQYSKGMRQRVKLAQALLHEPELLVLDEPMNGLDPMGRQEIAGILSGLAKEGKSILVSSHILAELESLCKNNLVLNWGRVLATGSRQDIRSNLKSWSEQLSITCDDPQKLADVCFRAGVLNGFDFTQKKDELVIRIREPESFYQRWTDLLLESGVTVYGIRGQSRSLQQIFEKVTQ